MCHLQTGSWEYLCGNVKIDSDGIERHCAKHAGIFCKECELVQYCCRNCQQEHWEVHKIDCKSSYLQKTWKPAWDEERRISSFLLEDDAGSPFQHFGPPKYLWGNMPAFDVLKLSQNEGPDYHRDLRILFPACGDFRNAIVSIEGLPSAYDGLLECFLNDRDFDVVARNAIMLLLAMFCDPDNVCEMILHIWYSASITSEMLRELRQKILPLIKDVLAKIEDESGHDLFSKTFKVGSCSVRLILSKESWQLMPAYLLGAPELDAANAEMARNSIMFAPSRRHFRERALFNCPPAWRFGALHQRTNGVLLPFAASRSAFTEPNPTFFPRTIEWPMKDSSDPLFDWDCHLVQTGCGNAKADVYGALYFYLRGLLRKFYRHLHSSAKTSFVVSHHNAISLPELMRDLQSSESAPILFDRIDCSNVADEEFLGIKKTLATVGPFLKPKSENPHATILTLFLNAIDNADSSSGNTGKRDAFRQHYRTLMSLNPWALQEFHSGEPSLRNPAFVRIAGDTKLLRDHEKFFNMHMIKQDFSAAAFHAGVKMKQHHTIIEAWPMRLKKEQGETGAKEEFELLRASGHVGCERYVEWVKAE
ncbi:hypothetical protein EV356DRAFT_345567 [Viridothelium virens]|uniref:MYND-type domain-containing protein n=1 Tax=Viridothelium virens TaxID=1048519 RepID=A0A6A6GXK7_VIRVR|nr:hypothetical protein EV356DRAFT_345567 [Viridothelium virens]